MWVRRKTWIRLNDDVADLEESLADARAVVDHTRKALIITLQSLRAVRADLDALRDTQSDTPKHL